MSELNTDSPFPIWTEVVHTSNVSGATGASGRARSDASLASISDILGWRVNKTDAHGIRRALDEAFTITRAVDGHTVVTQKQRGFRVQAGSSGIAEVTGAQRSLYERAKAIVEQVYPLLDGLMPLTSAPDWEDVNAIQSMIRPELEELVEQLGAEGGPVPQRVDNIFEMLLDYDPFVADATFADPATITGQLQLLRDRLGLERENVNTIDEELRLTHYETLVNYIDMLRLMWHSQRFNFLRTNSDAYLGTHTVFIERALSCVSESIHEIYRAMDSVFLGAAERESITININDVGVTIAELLDWIDDVATVRGFDIIREGGKDGIIHALAPTLARLVDILAIANRFIDDEKNKPPQEMTVPRALTTNRVMTNLQELQTHLTNALRFTREIQRADGPVVASISLEGVTWPTVKVLQTAARGTITLKVRGQRFRQGAKAELLPKHAQPLLPIDTVWRDSSKLTVTFDLTNAPPGERRLRILNDNGTETTTDAFIIITTL